jgi:hypothetical protein
MTGPELSSLRGAAGDAAIQSRANKLDCRATLAMTAVLG